MPASIDRHQVQLFLDSGAQLVEVLPRAEYAEEHLPTALNLPLKQLDAVSANVLDRLRPVIVYCWDALWDTSPRAAWRLEQLGFQIVYDYTGGKIDWIAAGWPTEGSGPTQPRVLAAIDREVATCGLDEPVGAIAQRLAGSATTCVVVNELRIVAGRLEHLDGVDLDDARGASQVMRPGPTTVRPSEDLGAVRQRMSSRHVSQLLVTTPDGELLGVLHAQES